MIYETNYSIYKSIATIKPIATIKLIATIATIKPIATVASIATITSPGKLPRPLGRGSGGGATSGGAVSRPHQRKHHWGRRRLACGWIGTIRIITMPSGCAGVPACYKRSFLLGRKLVPTKHQFGYCRMNQIEFQNYSFAQNNRQYSIEFYYSYLKG